MSPTYTIVAAYGAGNRVIGVDNKLPWKIPSDLKYFKQVTKKGVLVMGHNTWKSLKCKALAGRKHIIITSNIESVVVSDKDKANVFVVTTIESGLMLARNLAVAAKQPVIYIVGGAKIYERTLPIATGMILTEIDNPQDADGKYKFEGDSFFPEIGDDWMSIEDHRSALEGEPEYTVRMYLRADMLNTILKPLDASVIEATAPETETGL